MHFELVQNFPFFTILMCLISAVLCSVLNGKAARLVNTILLITVTIMSVMVFGFVLNTGESYVYMMGHFPAPWGNEIRVGVLEAFMATFFAVIMLLSMIGGHHKLIEEVDEDKHRLYYILVNLLLSSLLALVYTNDLFTAYVFVEINTISAAGLIMIRQIGRTIEAAVRYMIMSLLGSGLLLMGICMLYDLTGHLLMSNIKEQVQILASDPSSQVPLMITITIISIGLCIKCALFPFHAWLPDAYGYSTVSSAAMLSSLVSKGYIFLLIKIIYRVIGFEVYKDSHIMNILFIFALCGMIFGSVSAIRETDIRRMIAFSSVAQIGYIFMGIGMGTKAGMVAAIFHILTHAATKSLLFISAIGLTDVSGFSRRFFEITGSGYRNKIAGVGFTVGSLSMVGVPLFSGFISKYLFASGAVQLTGKMMPALICLAISTILNAIYFMKTVIRIYTPIQNDKYLSIRSRSMKLYCLTIVLFVAINVLLGVSSHPVVEYIEMGLEMFS
ncbi:MAG: proton-conducting transporter membrane subunit [Lachnospiraceae bacterium]|nr:proton-conducting transporter membrane subunit [Lachnospiraceae bacterium]